MYKNDLIFNDNFRYSINLNMDLHRLDKINGFVVTKTATDLLSEFIECVDSNNPKPQLFIGPYGKGKSHLLLVLSELLYSNEFSGCETLVNNLLNTDKEIENMLTRIKKKRYLPIVINGAFESFKSELILEIKRRLVSEGIDGFDYQTSYGMASDLIKAWEEDEYAFVRFDSYLKEKKLNVDDLKNGLENLDSKMLGLFKKVYKFMMYNQEFV